MTDQDQQVVKSIVIVTIAIAILGIVAFFIAQNVSDANMAEQQASSRSENAKQARIEPVGKVSVGAAKVAGAVAAARSGKEVVQASCGGCHVAGVAGAPKIGSKGDWEARVQTGMETMLAAVVDGKGIMPPRGGGDFTDAELSDAIKTMLTDSGL